MSPTDYLATIKAALTRSPVVQKWQIVNEMALSDRGHFRGRLILANGDFVEASEFFYIRNDGIEQQRYRYQWMDAQQQQLKKRWDNGGVGFLSHLAQGAGSGVVRTVSAVFYFSGSFYVLNRMKG